MLQIVLPTWCRDVRKMSVLWLDAWIMVLSKGKVKTILFDAYDRAIPRLRLYLEGMDSGNYVKLISSLGRARILPLSSRRPFSSSTAKGSMEVKFS